MKIGWRDRDRQCLHGLARTGGEVIRQPRGSSTSWGAAGGLSPNFAAVPSILHLTHLRRFSGNQPQRDVVLELCFLTMPPPEGAEVGRTGRVRGSRSAVIFASSLRGSSASVPTFHVYSARGRSGLGVGTLPNQQRYRFRNVLPDRKSVV